MSRRSSAVILDGEKPPTPRRAATPRRSLLGRSSNEEPPEAPDRTIQFSKGSNGKLYDQRGEEYVNISKEVFVEKYGGWDRVDKKKKFTDSFGKNFKDLLLRKVGQDALDRLVLNSFLFFLSLFRVRD